MSKLASIMNKLVHIYFFRSNEIGQACREIRCIDQAINCIDHRESWYGGWMRVRVRVILGWGCSETGVPLYWRNQPMTMITRLLYHTNRLIVSFSFQISSVLVSVLIFSYFKHQDYYENICFDNFIFDVFIFRDFYISTF